MVDEWPVPDSFLTGLFEIETSTILDAARGIGRHQEIRRGKRANCGLARTRQPGPGRIASSTARIRHLFSAAFVDQVPGGLDRRERSRYDWIIPANSTLPFQKTFRFFNRLKGIRPGLRSNVGLGGCVPPQPKEALENIDVFEGFFDSGFWPKIAPSTHSQHEHGATDSIQRREAPGVWQSPIDISARVGPGSGSSSCASTGTSQQPVLTERRGGVDACGGAAPENPREAQHGKIPAARGR